MNKLLKVVIVMAVACMCARQVQAAAPAYSGHMDLIVTMSCTAGVHVDGVEASTYTIASTGLGGAYLVPDSSATVKNTSTCASSLWQLLVATMAPIGAAESTGWTHHSGILGVAGTHNNPANTACLYNCPDANEYGFQALFASSMTVAGAYGTANGCPAASSTDWTSNVSTIATRGGWATTDTRITTGTANTYWNSQYTWTQGANTLGGLSQPDNINGNLGYMGPYNAGNATGVGQRALCTRVTMPKYVSAEMNGKPQVIRLSIFATQSL